MQHCVWSPTAGLWSSPLTTGSRPPPCAGFSFVAIDDHKGVLFGGRTEHGVMNDVYIINGQTMVCLCVVESCMFTVHCTVVVVVDMMHGCLVCIKCMLIAWPG